MEDLNSLYTSDNLDDVIRFYRLIKNREELITWMKKRPSAKIETSILREKAQT